MLALLALLAALGAGLLWWSYEQFLRSPLATGAEPVTYPVAAGTGVAQTLRAMEREGLLAYDWRWRLLLRLEPVTIQAGRYEIPPHTRPRELLALLASGRVVQYRFTLVEGWNYRQLRAALLAEERLATAPEQLDFDQVMVQLGREPGSPEGWFMPETYAYTDGETALHVLERALSAQEQLLEHVWQGRQDGLPVNSPYELLTLASIVEKESALGAERPDIAGVFVRRLQQGWRLETDPTVIYGMGEAYDGNIRRRDLRADTPWNTYVHRGLPPTPIAMPGPDALAAAAQPAAGSTMFFVADGTGGHVFSETLAEHNVAVRDLIRRQRAANKNDSP